MSFQLYYRRIKPNYYGNTVVLLQTQFSGGFVGANWVYTLTASATPDKTKCFQRIYSINVFERKEMPYVAPSYLVLEPVLKLFPMSLLIMYATSFFCSVFCKWKSLGSSIMHCCHHYASSNYAGHCDSPDLTTKARSVPSWLTDSITFSLVSHQ